MKVVILGGTGILSSGITKKCIEENYEVIHFNRSNNPPEYEIKTIIGNRYNENDLKKVLDVNPDIIIDMLCFDEKTAKMTAELFREKVQQYIFCSTSCVYTPVEGDTIITEESETKPFTEYGRNKLAAEKVFLEADKQQYFDTTIFRPSHVFGDTFTVSNLTLDGLSHLSRIKRGLDIILTNNGEKKFQACHSDNIGLAFAKACGNHKCYGNIYNIAGEEHMTWNDVYQIELDFIGSKSKICYMDTDEVINYDKERLDFLNTFTRYDWSQSMSKLKKDIPDYTYEVNFIKGITTTIQKNWETLHSYTTEDDIYNALLSRK